MPVLFGSILGSLFRWALTLLAAYLVEHQVWTQSDAGGYVSGLTLALVTLCWSLWTKYKDRIRFLTALHAPSGATEAHVDNLIASGQGATLGGTK